MLQILSICFVMNYFFYRTYTYLEIKGGLPLRHFKIRNIVMRQKHWEIPQDIWFN